MSGYQSVWTAMEGDGKVTDLGTLGAARILKKAGTVTAGACRKWATPDGQRHCWRWTRWRCCPLVEVGIIGGGMARWVGPVGSDPVAWWTCDEESELNGLPVWEARPVRKQGRRVVTPVGEVCLM